MAKLVVKSGKNAGEEYALNGDRLIMGRRSACPIPLVDVKASREHAIVIRKDEEFFVQDLSRNGTLLNGQPVSKAEQGTPLKFGDRIKIGDTEFEMVDEKNEPVTIDIPGYTIIERVGSGGMGTVYKAKQLSMDRIVALKVLNERYSSNSEFVDRFIREARAAGQLNHPNVIHVHDISRANGRHYFSMEFVDGQSVKELLRSEKKLEVNRALDIALQAAKALEFAHENKIVHRDVKPDNIMLTKEGIVKLADLGIAKTFEEQAASPKERRRVMGTPHYMAPEQALGKVIDHRVDVYSLGATLYHMVTGKTPFTGNTANEILKAHIQESLPPIQDLNAGVPDPVCFIVERMMAKLPEKRYPDMTRVIADIERVQRGAIAGIARIEAGDSTIQRAVNKKKEDEDREEKDSKKPKKEKEREAPDKDDEDGEEKSDTAELPTGAQTKIPGYLVAIGLIIVFIIVVGGVVHLAQRFSKSGDEGGGSGPTTGGGEAGGGERSNPEAQKLLQEAFDAQKANDPSEWDKKLRAVRDRFPTSKEATEAKRLLDEYANSVRESQRKNAQNLLDEAKTFEAANPTNLAEAIAKYVTAREASKDYPQYLEPAKAKVDSLTKQLQDEQAKAVAAAFRTAMDTQTAAKGKFDFDAARAALQDFIDKNAAAPQKADADAALAKVNAEAVARLKETQDIVANMALAAALNEWAKYTGEVKDSVAANDVKAAQQTLETKADQLTQDALTKGADNAKKYNYTEALAGVRAALRKVSSLKKWEEPLKTKEDSLRRQKDLHDKFVAAAEAKVKDGPPPLPFKIETKFGDVQWKISRIASDQVTLDAMAQGTPGLTKRFGELKPEEQYKLYMFCLPKTLSADDHKALAAFCLERGLTAQAELHTQKAAAPVLEPENK